VVEDAEVDAPMRASPVALALALVLAALTSSALAPNALAASPAATAPPPIAGNVTGPALVATSSNATFYLNASGGPAYSGGKLTGRINWTATLTGSNLTGSSVSPSNGTITAVTVVPVKLGVVAGAIAEPLVLLVEVTSASSTVNETSNLTLTFRIVVPYVVHATLVAGPKAAVLPFTVAVTLDGTPVGTVRVPQLKPNATYDLAFRCPTGGLASGYHTITLSIGDPHGLVTFQNGLTVESTTFYVAPAPADNTVWYVAGIIAFFGVLFIYGTRVAARRRGSAQR
jgi:hypothetical protein